MAGIDEQLKAEYFCQKYYDISAQIFLSGA